MSGFRSRTNLIPALRSRVFPSSRGASHVWSWKKNVCRRSHVSGDCVIRRVHFVRGENHKNRRPLSADGPLLHRGETDEPGHQHGRQGDQRRGRRPGPQVRGADPRLRDQPGEFSAHGEAPDPARQGLRPARPAARGSGHRRPAGIEKAQDDELPLGGDRGDQHEILQPLHLARGQQRAADLPRGRRHRPPAGLEEVGDDIF